MSDLPMGERPPFSTFNLGHLLTMISMLVAVVGGYFGISSELKNVGFRVERIETSITQLTALSIVTARQDEQLRSFDRRLDRLEERVK